MPQCSSQWFASWPLPVLQREPFAEWEQHQHHFDFVIARSPEEVRGRSLDDSTIYAEARGSGPGQLVKKRRS